MPGIDRVRLVNSGTEAAMSAIRLARGATGRDLILKFDGCYHGHSDSLLAKGGGSGLATLGIPSSPGVTEGAARDTLTAPYNDLEAVRAIFAERGDEIAVVAVEPVAANMGVVPPAPGFLEGLRDLCDAHGSLLLFDEVITGFRIAYGGAQSVFGVTPDLTRARQGHGRRLPVRRLRRTAGPDGAPRPGGPGLSGGHAEREPGRGGGGHRRARPRRSRRSVPAASRRRPRC